MARDGLDFIGQINLDFRIHTKQWSLGVGPTDTFRSARITCAYDIAGVALSVVFSRAAKVCAVHRRTGFASPRGAGFKLGKLMRFRIWLGILVGSTIGGLIPELWGASMISYSSVWLSGIGAFVGLWIGYRTG